MQEDILKPVPEKNLSKLRRRQLERLFSGEQKLRLQFQGEVDDLRKKHKDLEANQLRVSEQFAALKALLFSESSEKSPRKTTSSTGVRSSKPRDKTTKLPSERYPNAEVEESRVECEEPPTCSCCGLEMTDSGMSEVSEQLTVIPRQFKILRQSRAIYRCGGCHGSLVSAASEPRIKPGSSFSDAMILDVSLSKFCDLIPMERYVQMAARQGLVGLAPHSLIETTHYLADLLLPVYEQLKKLVQASQVILADETPHRMLEGDKKSRWYLWGFSSEGVGCYFSCHSTRSGDVASEFLDEAGGCEVLVSDDFGGYAKALSEINQSRREDGQKDIARALCNAHARRKFKTAEQAYPDEAAFYLDQYKKIYALEAEFKDLPDEDVSGKKETRGNMTAFYEGMKSKLEDDLPRVSSQSSLAAAIKYFEKNYDDLTYSLKDIRVPLDNNLQERALRNPVIGRKTWYGTHSKRGAKTAQILTSLVESCKMLGVNPREYFPAAVDALLKGGPPICPSEYKKANDSINSETPNS